MSAETALLRAFVTLRPDEAARLVEQLPSAALAEVMAALDVEQAAELAIRIMPASAALALAELGPESASAIVLAMEPRAAAVIVLRLTPDDRDRLYEALPKAHASQLANLTDYGAGRAGGRMDPRAPMLPESLPVSEVLDRLRLAPEGALNYVYAVDTHGRLSGVVNLRELLGAAHTATLAAIMRRDPDALLASDPVEAVASHPAWKRHHALPVVDREGRLLGALRYSAFRAIEAELGKRSQVSPDTEAASALAELCVLGVTAVARLAGVTLAIAPDHRAGGES